MSEHPNDQLVIDRVVRAIDALVADIDAAPHELAVVRRDGAGPGAPATPGRRWMFAAAAALVAVAAVGIVVANDRDRTSPVPASVPSAPTVEPAIGGTDPRTSDPESVLPYVLDLPGGSAGGVSGYTTPATGATGVTLLGADGSLISIETFPPDSDQPLPRIDGEPVTVPSGDAAWVEGANVGGRHLNWWGDGVQYWAWGAGVAEADVLAATIEWDATGQPIEGFTLDAVWSVDELTFGASYARSDGTRTATLELSRWPDGVIVGNPAARQTVIDGHPAWRNDDGPVVGVSWRLDDGSWMSLTTSSDDLDEVLDALRPHDVAPAASAGTIEIDLGDRTLTYPVIVGRDREVFRDDAVLLAGSAPVGVPSTGTQIIVIPPDLESWPRSPLEQLVWGDRIRWITPDGRVIEHLVGSYGDGAAGFDNANALNLTAAAGWLPGGRYSVGAFRVTPLGDESALRVVDTGGEARSVSLARPDGVVTYEVAGRPFTVERGILPVPSIVPTDGVCTLGMCQPLYPPDPYVQVIGDQVPQLGDLRVWLNVPDGIDIVRIVDGTSETWQVPVDGVAAWLAPTSADWEVTAIDVDRPFIGFFDAEALASWRTLFDEEHPLDIPDSSTDPHAHSLNEAAIAAVDQMRACIAAADRAIDATATWASCLADAQASFGAATAAIEAGGGALEGVPTSST